MAFHLTSQKNSKVFTSFFNPLFPFNFCHTIHPSLHFTKIPTLCTCQECSFHRAFVLVLPPTLFPDTLQSHFLTLSFSAQIIISDKIFLMTYLTIIGTLYLLSHFIFFMALSLPDIKYNTMYVFISHRD